MTADDVVVPIGCSRRAASEADAGAAGAVGSAAFVVPNIEESVFVKVVVMPPVSVGAAVVAWPFVAAVADVVVLAVEKADGGGDGWKAAGEL